MTEYKIVREQNSANHPIGTVCYEFHGHDYGAAREDTMGFGEPYITMTLDPKGGGPYFTVACDSLEPQPMAPYFIGWPNGS